MLFWLFEPLQEKLQLVGVEPLTTFSEEVMRESVELLLEKDVLRSERFVLGSQSAGFVFRRFDAVDINSLCLQLR